MVDFLLSLLVASVTGYPQDKILMSSLDELFSLHGRVTP